MKLSSFAHMFRGFVVYLTILAFLASCTAQEQKRAAELAATVLLGNQYAPQQYYTPQQEVSQNKKFSSFDEIPEAQQISSFIRDKAAFVSALNILISNPQGTPLSRQQIDFIKKAAQIDEATKIVNEYAHRNNSISLLNKNEIVVASASNDLLTEYTDGLCEGNIGVCRIANAQAVTPLFILGGVLITPAIARGAYVVLAIVAVYLVTRALYEAVLGGLRIEAQRRVNKRTFDECPKLAAGGHVTGCESVSAYSGQSNDSGKKQSKGQTGNREPDPNCDEEWEKALTICDGLIKQQNTDNNRLRGGYNDTMNCARGFVSEQCGGNKVSR